MHFSLLEQATIGLWSYAGLQNSHPLLSSGDLDELSSQSDLVFDVRSGFASGSVHARLQVSVYSGYNLCHPGCPKIDSYILTSWP